MLALRDDRAHELGRRVVPGSSSASYCTLLGVMGGGGDAGLELVKSYAGDPTVTHANGAPAVAMRICRRSGDGQREEGERERA